ncbi:acyl carrier protein [Paenibacillus sp. ACRRX]|uniref:acyl carrier protein n=1 Tax=unclassified Paenibacillus TaxID=185978 RepID=UPI001EF6A22B|nr:MULTISPECIES: acyl carrier protein [unclassified Paenibacillus]MCG7409128.1 acyl carrier protein [Paenibacillus sp. ACRRX]MDK8181878.1 acyl carrier protein [Paenibacillus sp. UMB4589-SE434]
MNKDLIFNIVINHSRELLPELEGHKFQYTDRLTDLGANSVDRAEIVMMTMESLSLHIPRVELFGASNIGELVDLIYDKLQLV